MKYEMCRTTIEDDFKPFSVTLFFTNKKEYIHFHDKVMKHIIRGTNHRFCGDIYNMGEGEIEHAHGTIEGEDIYK